VAVNDSLSGLNGRHDITIGPSSSTLHLSVDQCMAHFRFELFESSRLRHLVYTDVRMAKPCGVWCRAAWTC